MRRGRYSSVEETIWAADGFGNLRKGRQCQIMSAIWKFVYLQGCRRLERVVVGNWLRPKSGVRNSWNFVNEIQTGTGSTVGIQVMWASQKKNETLQWKNWNESHLMYALLREVCSHEANDKVSCDRSGGSTFCWFLFHKFCTSFHWWLVWFRQEQTKIMKFRTDSLGNGAIRDAYHLAFSVCGAMHFSVSKRMLTFLLNCSYWGACS